MLRCFCAATKGGLSGVVLVISVVFMMDKTLVSLGEGGSSTHHEETGHKRLTWVLCGHFKCGNTIREEEGKITEPERGHTHVNHVCIYVYHICTLNLTHHFCLSAPGTVPDYTPCSVSVCLMTCHRYRIPHFSGRKE